jgi:hypothetical protein
LILDVLIVRHDRADTEAIDQSAVLLTSAGHIRIARKHIKNHSIGLVELVPVSGSQMIQPGHVENADSA